MLSCSLLLCNGVESSKELRELVGGLVLSDPDKYSTALLGRESGDYVQWLLKDDSWGGEHNGPAGTSLSQYLRDVT